MRLFSHFLPGRISALLASESALIYSCYLFGCATYFQASTAHYLFRERGLVRCLIVTASILLGFYFNHLYDKGRLTSRKSLLLQMCNVFGLALVTQGVLGYLAGDLRLPRTVMIIGSALCFCILLFWRIFYSGYIWKLFGTENVLFVGASPVLREIAEQILLRPELGMGVAGYVDDEWPVGTLLVGGPVLGPCSSLEQIAGQVKPRRIVAGTADWRDRLPLPALLALSRAGVEVTDAATMYEQTCGRVCSREFRPSQIIFDNELRSRPGSVALQSIYTNLIAIVGIVISLPFLVGLAIAVKIDSRGPVFSTDERVGFNGIRFKLSSFRVTGPDSKLTRFGEWLRRTHLENLPYLFNVLRGEMTLVGPRPERPEYVEILSKYVPFYHQRHTVKPGITGWSRIHSTSGDVGVNSLVWLEYDLYYTKHISLALDTYILFHWMRSRWPF